MSQWLAQKEPVRYTNKLIKKTTDTNYREYLQLTKNLILANIIMNDKRSQKRKGGVYRAGFKCVEALGRIIIRGSFLRYSASCSQIL